MCLSTVYNHEKQDENILCRFVASITGAVVVAAG